ncbi:hypothetical protein J6590_065226 [Homalodisca vitripennis]|nr:hypothetical protein J6590_065226 [Homalodisca vitripennis]
MQLSTDNTDTTESILRDHVSDCECRRRRVVGSRVNAMADKPVRSGFAGVGKCISASFAAHSRTIAPSLAQ